MTGHMQNVEPEAALEAALADCASEPIRIPGAIQPHGLLLALRGEQLCIEQISANCETVLGLKSSQLLGRPLSALVSSAQAQLVTLAFLNPRGPENDSVVLSIGVADYNASFHRIDDVLIVELEPFVEPVHEQAKLVTRVLRNLQAATTLETLYDISVHEIQALTGYDRVMIYRFEPQGHGKVVAQALSGTLPSYLGLNFPGSDIPAQARALYRLNWIRVIPDAAYIPVPLIPVLRPDNHRPLDLSLSTLRSVSPVHCEYLKNMGVRSSMSISLLDNRELWGLIACGHPSPLLVPREVREACVLIGQLLSAKIAAIVASLIQQEREEKVVMLGQLAVAMSCDEHGVLEGLVGTPDLLQALTHAEGAAVLIEDRLHLFGQCPSPNEVKALHAWIRDSGLEQQRAKEQARGLQGLGIFHSNSIQADHLPSAAYREVVSGVIAFILPKPVDNAVMWFRPQLTSTMNWSGDPTRHLSPGPVGSATHRLHPRQSFDVWEEQVTGLAQPWSIGDLYAAEDIRRSALESDLERQVHREQEAVRLRDELVAVVSHDLRNPMSIIIMQCGLMKRWASKDDSGENRHIRRALGTIENATTRMSSLLEDLLDTAKVDAGRYQLDCRPLNVVNLLEEACNLLVTLTTEKDIELNCTAAPGLMINADSERIFQVLSNLVVNAIKFTPQGGKIDIDAVSHGSDVLINVKDNGAGIAPENLAYIFQRYWSIKEDNPHGNGLGLYISQGIIAAHGGLLTVTSEPGAGSVFTFSLPAYLGTHPAGDTPFLKRNGTTQRLAKSIAIKLERQQMDDRTARTALLNELNHRVKNALSTVQAFASLTANSSDSIESFRKSFDARIFAFSRAHDALARAEWQSTELVDLVAQIRESSNAAGRVAFVGDNATLEPRISLALSMVLHELMANAVQHGALALPGGQVTVNASLDRSSLPHVLTIDWIESAGAPGHASTADSTGFRLIRRSIERELKGRAEVTFSSAGLHCSISIPWFEPTVTHP